MAGKGLWITPTTFAEISPATNALSTEIATRDRSIDFSSLLGYLPNPDETLKKLGKDIAVYKELLTDAHVASCVESRQAAVRSLLWEIDRGKSKSRQAKMIEKIFGKLPLTKIISEILDAALYGYQPMEIMWEGTTEGIVPRDVVGKPQEWFVFDNSNTLRILTKSNLSTGEELPANKFLLPRRRPSYNNPYGIALLGPTFWPVVFKRGGWKFWVTFTEKYGMPHLIATYRAGTDEKTKRDILDMLDKLVQDGIGILPEGSKVEPLDVKNPTANAQIYKMLCDFCNAEISKALLSETLTTEIGASGGSYAAAKEHGSIRAQVSDSDKRMVEETLNALIATIVRLNFSESTEVPKFVLYEEEDVDLDLAERDQKLGIQGQVKFKKPYVMRAYGFQEDEIEITAPTAPTPKPNNGPQFAESAASGNPSDAIIDRALAETDITPWLDTIRKYMEQCNSLEELRDKLIDAYKDMDARTIGDVLTLAFTEAELAGRYEIAKQTK
jgi:phage gp29-like protein